MDERKPLIVRLPADVKAWLAERSFNTGISQNESVIQAVTMLRDEDNRRAERAEKRRAAKSRK